MLIHDHHPGYLTWPQYQANQQTLAANAAAHGHNRNAGPAREGPALLQGLIICGRCGRRMTVRYHCRNDGTTVPDYVCQHDGIQNAAPICQHMPGAIIDAAVAVYRSITCCVDCELWFGPMGGLRQDRGSCAFGCCT